MTSWDNRRIAFRDALVRDQAAAVQFREDAIEAELAAQFLEPRPGIDGNSWNMPNSIGALPYPSSACHCERDEAFSRGLG